VRSKHKKPGVSVLKANAECSDPAEGNVKLPKILLNGNNICMVIDEVYTPEGCTNSGADGTRRRRTDSSGG